MTDIQQTMLTPREWRSRREVSPLQVANLRYHEFEDEIRGNMVRQITAVVWGQDLGVIRYPATWWDAVKERFAPAWYIKRWPIAYISHDIKAEYPSFKYDLPGHTAVIRTYRNGR